MPPASPTRLATLALCGGALLAPLLWKFYWPAGASGIDVTGHQLGRDFINAWVGPQLAFSGEVGALFDLSRYHAALDRLFGRDIPEYNWSYPPHVLPLLAPFGRLPYFVALALWTLAFGAGFAAVALAIVPAERRRAALFALLLAPATVVNVVSGQNGFLTAALLIGGVLLLDRRPVLAGVLFGLLTVKPQLGLVLPLALLALGAWRAIAAAVVTTLLLVASSLLLLGVEPWRQFATVTTTWQLWFLQHPEGQHSLLMPSVFISVSKLGASFGQASAIQAIVATVTIIVAAGAVRATRDGRRRAFVLAAATPLVTPYLFFYDLTALTAVLLWRLCDARPLPERSALVLRLAWLAPAAVLPLHLVTVPVCPIIFALVFALAVHEAVGERGIGRAREPIAPRPPAPQPA